MKRFFHSIPLKICLLVLGGEILVLALLGFIYVGRIHYEMDAGIARKMVMPVHLYEQGMLTEDSLSDFLFINSLLQEEVLSLRLIDVVSGEQIFMDDSFRYFEVERKNVRLSEFTKNGTYQIAGLVPLRHDDNKRDYLYVRIKAERHVAAKHKVFMYYLLGALGVILFSAALGPLITYRLFISRIRQVSRVLKSAEQGDFSARVREGSSVDELGQCIIQVNSLVSTIENYIAKLNELNSTGEALANSLNRDEVIRVVAEVVEKQLNARCVAIYERDVFQAGTDEADQYTRFLNFGVMETILAGEMYLISEPVSSSHVSATSETARSLLFVPIVEEGRVIDIMVFRGLDGRLDVDPVTREFARTLSRLVNNAFNRIKSLHEITRAESKYRALFMTASIGIYRVDGAGRIEDVNPALAVMGGYESIEEMCSLVTDSTQVYVDLADRDRIMAELEKHDRVKDIEIYMRRKDGSTFPVLMSAHTVKDKHGNLVAIEGNIVDISERMLREEAEREQVAAEAASAVKSEMLVDLETKNHQLQESLEEVRLMQKQLLQSEKMAVVGAMAGGLAHDLNNFLAGAVSYPDLLLTQLPENHAMREPFEVIREAGKRAVEVVNDLLALSQGSAKVWESKELNAIVEKSLQSLDVKQVQLLNPDLQLRAILCSEPTYIRCAPMHIEKAVISLIKNGMEAAGENGRVEITTALQKTGRVEMDSPTLQDRPYVVLTISDDGPGIAEEHHENMFEPFYFRKTVDGNSGGTGLGLAVAWSVVQEHEGAVTVKSTAGSTSFHIYLPVTDFIAGQEDAAEQFTDDLRGSGTILIVDDEPLQRDIAGKMLAELGYKVYLVASGSAALDFIEKRSVDLVLLDMLMPPGMNGRETYQKMARIRPGQKTLIVSGYSETSDVKEVLVLGAGGVLQKPYSLTQLGRAVLTEIKRV